MSKKDLNLNMTKEQERSELHRAIWQIANDLRGSVDGWDFKQYVLGMLFYRFISENLTRHLNDEKSEGAGFDYAKLDDKTAEYGRSETVIEKGFYILPSELFVNVCKNARNDANLNETLTGIFRDIENSAKGTESEADLKGLFDDIDVNSNKLGGTVERRNQRLAKLMESIGGLRLGNYSDNTIDAFGDAYEFLMTMYASNAGKSGGEFYTPQEVSELLAEITTIGKTEVNKVYDPACGSGSLLLKFAKVLGKENVRQGFYGQESNLTTYNLCRINMFLHDINYNNFNIAHGDTLIDPKHWDEEPFDAIVSNPPYSTKWEGDANPLLINDPRFSPAGVLAPKSKSDLAFTMHMLSWLSTSGVAAIVEYPGVLYRSGAEQDIRKYLVDNNYIDAVIQLPSDLFFGPTIATCIIVLKKSKKDNKTLFIDASLEFVRGGTKNKLTDSNRAKILTGLIERKDIEYFTKLVDNKLIAKNDYNLAVESYLKKDDEREIVNIEGLNKKIAEIVSQQKKVRVAIDKHISELEQNHSKKSSIIENLIKKSCPNGIEFKEMWEITAWDKKFKGISREKQVRVIKYPYVLANRFKEIKQINGNILLLSTGNYTGWTTKELAGKNLCKGEIVAIPWGGKASVKYYNGEFVTSDNRIATSLDINVLSNKFLYYWMFENMALIGSFYRGAGIKHPSMKKILSLKIPLPPLSVQKEIVKILDSFSELEAELEAELESRKKQYEYYRGKLLTFKEYAK